MKVRFQMENGKTSGEGLYVGVQKECAQRQVLQKIYGEGELKNNAPGLKKSRSGGQNFCYTGCYTALLHREKGVCV